MNGGHFSALGPLHMLLPSPAISCSKVWSVLWLAPVGTPSLTAAGVLRPRGLKGADQPDQEHCRDELVHVVDPQSDVLQHGPSFAASRTLRYRVRVSQCLDESKQRLLRENSAAGELFSAALRPERRMTNCAARSGDPPENALAPARGGRGGSDRDLSVNRLGEGR
jgi:hypothetical protein